VPDARTFLLATFEAGGMVAPMLTLARRLRERGHRVRLMSDRCNREECESAGVAFRPWQRAPSKPGRDRAHDVFRDWAAPDPALGFLELVEHVLIGPARAYAEDTLEELRREPADLVIASEMLFGVQAGCEALGQRHALLAANISLFPLPGVPPFGPGLLPARTPEEHARHAELARESEALLDRALPALNAARAALGLPALAHVLDQHARARRLLLATARAFDYAPPALPAHVAYVGPLLDEPGWVSRAPLPVDDARPAVLVAFSTTFQNHVAVLQRVTDALGRLPVRALLTLGGGVREGEVRCTDNVTALASASHDAALRRAALVVTHGGHGTVMRALVHGVPLLVMPLGRDQHDNAARVAARGAGLVLAADADEAAIAAAVQRLLVEPAFALNAQALGARIREEIARSPLLPLLESLAGEA